MTISKIKYFLCFLALGLLANCGGEAKPLDIGFTNISNSVEYAPADLMKADTQRGIIRLMADDQLTNFKDSLSVDLVFNILDASSSLTLVAFTNSMATKSGTSVRFTMKDRNLEVDVFTQDYPMYHLCHLENFITANNDVRLKVQLLNSVNGPIISIWNQSNQFSEGRRRNFNAYNINTAECSSHNLYAPINMFGLGNRWGLELDKVKMKSVKRTETYVL